MSNRVQIVLLTALLTLGATAATAQPEEIPHFFAPVLVDSGEIQNLTEAKATIFSTEVRVDMASWVRIYFEETTLGQIPGRNDGTILRITSLKDGAVQHHTARTLAQWDETSAFFNGEEVLLEVIARPGAAPSRVAIHQVMAGEEGDTPQESICGPTDDRLPSNIARSSRLVPIGCTSWLINDQFNCFLSAGHCVASGNGQVVEFNVPLSNSNGSINHPPPEDQYAVDTTSMQFTNAGIGNDWAYFGTFPNTETGLTAFQAQGDLYVLAQPPAAPGGETIRITGYGTTGAGVPREWNQAQKTHTGPLTGTGGTSLQYATDTTGGNSGSAVFDETNGMAIGIHTHAGCSAGGGANNGTGLDNAGVTAALANPMGICLTGPPFDGMFRDGFESGDLTGWDGTGNTKT